MDPEDRRIIRENPNFFYNKENLEVARENQEMLRKMRRGKQFIGNIARIFIG